MSARTANAGDIESQSQQQKPTTAFLPVLIVPGFMSSGMECEESAADESWVGKRIWCNIPALGFESLQIGSALQENEAKKENDEDYDEHLHEEYKNQVKCKNIWVHHLSLSTDMIHERPGMKVRVIPSLSGVDYLYPGALTNMATYVFGPVIQALQKVGYQEGINLDAVPYDWRLPPSVLEERDTYFTNTMRRVEKMYEDNNQTPVVLVGHSLGCRTAHYFLNFCKQAQGKEWLNKYIHTYMPVGAPHLGAPKALRASVTGDKMGLDTFLTDEEGLIIGRSFGSGAWLFPNKVPNGSLANAFIRREGILEVTISPIECENLFIGRGRHSPQVRVVISVDGETCSSEYQRPKGENAIISFPKPFRIMLPLGKDETSLSGSLIVSIHEKGFRYAKHDAKVKGGWFYSCWFLPVRILVCFALHMVLLPCMVIYWIVWVPAVKAADEAAKKTGASTTLATSRAVQISQDGTLNLTLVHVKEFQDQACCSNAAPSISRTIEASVSCHWIPPPVVEDMLSASRAEECIIASPKGEEQPHFFNKKRKEDTYYYPVSGDQLLKREGLQGTLDLVKNTYFPDPIGPRWASSTDAPPVKRVKAVYGINLLTEIGGVYRRKSSIPKEEGKVEAIHELDSSVNVEDDERKHYVVKQGIIYETKSAPQIVAGENSSAVIHRLGLFGKSLGRFSKSRGKLEFQEGMNKVIHRSGDGTVPYWSLQQCRAWQGECEVMIDEVEGAEHREILADRRFHAILIDYVTQATASLAVKSDRSARR